MTTFTTIPNASLEPGKPIRSIDGLALRDNPIAITEGAADSPRIVGKAAKRLADYPVLSVSASDTHSAEIGSNFQAFATSTNSTSEVLAFRYTISLYTGSLRFRTNQSGGSFEPYQPNTASTLRIFKNGTLIQTFTKDGEGFVTRTTDIAIVPGDVIEWRHSIDNSNGTGAKLSNTVILGSNAYTTRQLLISALEANNV